MSSGVGRAPRSSEDELAAAVDAFEAAIVRGESVTPRAWAERHGDLGPELLPLLDGLMLLRRAASGAPLRAPDALPAQLGGYRIVRELGRGGMGVVYLAEQASLGRQVALKVLPADLVGDAGHVERFRRESLAAAQLAHPNIVAVYDVAIEGGRPYYAMQYVEGDSLQRVLHALGADTGHASRGESSGARALIRALRERGGRRGGSDDSDEPALDLGFEDAARIALEVCRALAHAHAGGVVHRDVKPGNILIDLEGRALVADFGLCRMIEEGDLTRSGELVGTLRYMAPEQIDGEAGTQSDVYGVGMVLYELLTLRPAFAASRRASLVRDVLHTEPVRPRRIDPRIPADLETITLKATAKLEAQRYASAADMASDLEAYLEGRPITARRPSAAYLLRLFYRRNRAAVLLALALLAGLLALAAVYVRDLRAAQRDLTESNYVAHLNAAEAAMLGGAVGRAETDLAGAAPELRSWEWWHLAARADQALLRIDPFPGEHLVRSLAYDPSGTRLLVSGHDGVAVLDADDGRTLGLLEGQDPRVATWTADGAHIVLGKDSTGLVLVAAGDLSTPLAALPGVSRPEHLLALQDGRVVFGTLEGEVGVWRPESGEHERRRASGGAVLWLGRAPDPAPRGADPGLADPGPADLWTGVRALGADGVLRGFGPDPLEVELTALAGAELIAADLDLDSGTGALAFSSGSIHIVSLADGQLLQSLAPGAASRALLYDPRVARLHSGGDDDQLRSWDLDNAAATESRLGHVDDIFHIAGREDRTQLATGDERGNVLVWSPSLKGGLSTLCGHVDDVATIEVGPGGRFAASGGLDGLVILWDLDVGRHRWVSPSLAGIVDSVRFGADGRRIYASSHSGLLVTLDAASGAVLARCPEPAYGAGALALDGERVLVSRERSVEVWSPGLDRLLATWRVGAAPVRRLEPVPGTRWLLAGCADGTVVRMDLDSGAVLGVTTLAPRQLSGLAVDPVSGLAAATVYDSRVYLLDPARDEVVARLDTAGDDGVGELLFSVAFGVEGSRIFATTRSGRLVLWDAASRGRLVDLTAHPAYAIALAVDPAHGRVLTGSSDGVLRVFDTATSREKQRVARELGGAARSAEPTWSAHVDALGRRAQEGLHSPSRPRSSGAYHTANALTQGRPASPRKLLLTGMLAVVHGDREAADRALAAVRDAVASGVELGPEAQAYLALFHARRGEYLRATLHAVQARGCPALWYVLRQLP